MRHFVSRSRALSFPLAAAIALGGAACNSLVGNDSHPLGGPGSGGSAPGGHGGAAGTFGPGTGGSAGGASGTGAGGSGTGGGVVAGAGGSAGGAAGAGGTVAVGGGSGSGAAGRGGSGGSGATAGAGGATGSAGRGGSGGGGASGGGGTTGGGGGAQCGERGQPCCSGGTCAARATCDGTACIAADVWASTADGTFDFNGGTWAHPLVSGSTAQLPGVNALWGTTSTFVVGVGSTGLIFRNDGNGWHKDMAANSGNDLFGVGGSSSTDVWAVGDARMTHYTGSGWVDVTAPQSNVPYFAVWLSSPGNGWAVGEEGCKAQLVSGAWTDKGHSSNGYQYTGIWGTSASNIYAVGSRHTLTGLPLYISHYDGTAWDDSQTQAADPNGTAPRLRAVWGSDASHVWVVGDGGTVLFWNGTLWAPQLSGAGTAETLYAVWGSGPRDVWVAGTAGARHFNGQSWSPIAGLGSAVTLWLSAQ
jgi:hypothetical protein